MGCDLSEAKLWSWIDRDAEELEQHLAGCSDCRRRAGKIREDIRRISANLSEVTPLPEKIGPYSVKGLLGEGGQALVYEAEQESPRRTIALKVLRGGRFAGEKHVKHFLRETQTLARLHHPAIATIYEAGRTRDGHNYFAMELVRGQPLLDYLNDHDLNRQQRLEIFRKICLAVQYAHDNGVIHRDLKPANIMITTEGEPKILDFGLAHLTHPDPEVAISMTRTGLMSGTPRYMSPEQVRGKAADIGTPSDVYSLGVVLYELLTGKPPNDAHSFTPETVMAICEEEPVRPGKLDSSLKGDLETIVLKALAKDPARRYATAAGLGEDLRRFVGNEPIKARPPSRLYTWRKAFARHPVVGVFGILVLLLAVIWAGQVMQAPFDREQARISLLEWRFQYYLANPASRVYRSNALDAPQKYPGLPEAVMVRGLALNAIGEKGLALKYLDDELKKDPDQWLYKALISAMGIVKDSRVAEEFPTWAHGGTDRSLADSWYLRSFTTLDPEQALAWSHIALSHDPDHALALENVARLGTITGHLNNSLKAATRLLELQDERRGQWLDFRSIQLCRLGRPREALADIEKIVEDKPSAPRSYIARAQIHRWLGDYERAVEDYTKAIHLGERQGQSTAWYYYHRGTPLWILGRLEEAAEDYRKAYRLLASPSYGNVRLALVLFEMGNDREAREALHEARLQSAEDDWLTNILACLAGDITPAQLVAEATEDPPQELCEAYYYGGESFLLRGERADARRMFQACIEKGTAIDLGNYRDRLSEFELAQWRLSQLDGSRGETKPNQ